MNCPTCNLGGDHKSKDDCIAALKGEMDLAHEKLDKAGAPQSVGGGLMLKATVSSRIEWLNAGKGKP